MVYTPSIVVVGAGAAGVAAAVSSSRHGADVLLVEKTPRLGGTVTHSLIHSLGGLYDSSGNYINNDLTIELAERLLKISSFTRKRKIGKVWTLTTSPEDYEKVMEDWVREKSNIKVLRESSITSVNVENATARSVEIAAKTHTMSVQPNALIDTTGSAEIVRLIDSGLVTDDHRQAAAGLIFRMNNVAKGALTFPKNIGLLQSIRQAVQNKILTKECELTWLDIGLHEDEAYIKLHVPLPSAWRKRGVLEKALQNAQKTRDDLISFLIRLPDFTNAYLSNAGVIGIRNGGRINGEYLLTVADIKNKKKFKDAACRCCWPIEYWDQEKGVEIEYLEDGDYYEIPLRALKVKGIENVWASGKCLSADTKAQASARVVGSCWSMGDAVGKAVSNL